MANQLRGLSIYDVLNFLKYLDNEIREKSMVMLSVLYSLLNYVTLQFLLLANNFEGERLAFQKINGAAPSNFLRTSSYTYVSKHTANW